MIKVNKKDYKCEKIFLGGMLMFYKDLENYLDNNNLKLKDVVVREAREVIRYQEGQAIFFKGESEGGVNGTGEFAEEYVDPNKSVNSLQQETTKLISIFEKSFVNENNELILLPKYNIYLNLNVGINDAFSLKCRFIESISRSAFSDSRYKNYFLERFNKFLGTNFTREEVRIWIYRLLGNGVDKVLTKKFVKSGYNLKVLKKS